MAILKTLRNAKASRWLAGMTLALLLGPAAQALPEGANVVHGSATINVNGQNMTIQQASQQAIINWNGFSISAAELVQFLQPNQMAAVLNRVTGVDPSVINGILQGNGNVFLINPNGVLIGPGGMVNTGGFLASTLDLSNADFLSGRMHFQQSPGHDLAAVVNQGRIEVAPGGFVMLLAPSVANEGMILAKSGQVALGAGSEATVNFDGRNLIHFALGQSPAGEGTMVMSQASANNVLAQVVNQIGIEEAGSQDVRGQILAQDIDLSTPGTLNATPYSVVGHSIIGTVGGDANLASQMAFDGGNIIITAGGNITYDTLVAEPLVNSQGQVQGGLVSLTAGAVDGGLPGGSSIVMNSGGLGIAADRVQLSATGNISTAAAANSISANAPNGSVALSLRPGLIDSTLLTNGGSTGGVTDPGSGLITDPGNSMGGSGGNNSSLPSTDSHNSSGSGFSTGSSSQAATGVRLGSDSSSQSSSQGGQAFGVVGGRASGSSQQSSSSGSGEPLLQTQPVSTDGVATYVGQNGTLVRVTAGGDVTVDSVNTVIVDRIAGRNVSVRSQTGSVLDSGDIAGSNLENRDIIATQNANLSAKDFIGTLEDPLEVDILGDLDVLALNEVDGISGVLIGYVGNRYLQNAETAGVVLLNPGRYGDGIAQAQRGVLDNALPGDDHLGGGSTLNLFLVHLTTSVDEDEWLEILRGTVVWEDSPEEAEDGDL
jgi:filamentous hemagglutinin family protein